MASIRINIYYSSALTLLLTLATTIAFAQDKPFPFQARNALYVEFGGANQFYSINYDRLIAATENQNWFFGYRIGGSLAGKQLVKSRLIGEVYALLGNKKNHLEIGIGSSLGRNWGYDQLPYGGSANVIISPIVAYRIQPPKGISFFRVSISPSWTINGQDKGNSHSTIFGIGFGRSF